MGYQMTGARMAGLLRTRPTVGAGIGRPARGEAEASFASAQDQLTLRRRSPRRPVSEPGLRLSLRTALPGWITEVGVPTST
jgi:hypothetical protein